MSKIRRVLATVWIIVIAAFIVIAFIGSQLDTSGTPSVNTPGFAIPTTPAQGSQTQGQTQISGLPEEQTYPGSPYPEGTEAIDRYDTAITIERNGDLSIRESIVYDFTNFANRHGILRLIPVRYRYDNTYDRIYPIENIAVSGPPGTPTQLDLIDEGQFLKLKIGDPDTTITGIHTYEIAYTVRGALNAFRESDELYWNVIGDQWDVPVRNGTATVHLTDGNFTAERCFAGPTGSALSCQQAELANPAQQATFAQDNLPPNAGMTVVLAIPKGSVTATGPILERRWNFTRAFTVSPVTIGAGTALLVLGTALVIWLAWTRGRDRRYPASPAISDHGSQELGPLEKQAERKPLFADESTPVEYRPPDGILPGQLGTLIDEIANPLDVTATIVDFAVRNKLAITEIPKKSLFGKTDWELSKLDSDHEDLRQYERTLYDALFADREKVKLSALKTTFHAHLAEVQSDLYDDMVTQGWFSTRPDKERLRWVWIGAAILAIGLGLSALAAWKTQYGLIPLGIAGAGLALIATARFMPHRTALGSRMLLRVEGFRRFMATAEAERMAFAEEEHIFAQYLPYAIVFDLVDRWAKAFEGLERDPMQTDTYWYHAPYAFNAVAFSSAMDNFTTTTGGTLVSTPSSSGSSGFGGGGSSGGGGGGGGGGSW